MFKSLFNDSASLIMFSINWSDCSAALLRELLNKVVVTGILYTTTQINGEAYICKITSVHFVWKIAIRSLIGPPSLLPALLYWWIPGLPGSSPASPPPMLGP